MCMAVFLGTERPAPLIAWRKEAPAFNVVALGERERDVAAKFTRPHLVYAGAHTNCSCGFKYGVGGEPDEDISGKESVAALRRYLEERLREGSTVELYACWEGDWAEPENERRQVTLDHFGGETFELAERVFLTVVP